MHNMHSIHRRLEAEQYYKHQVRSRDLYPWELEKEARRARVISKTELKERLERDLRNEHRPPADQPDK